MSECGCGSRQAESIERKTLVLLLGINAFMFFLELVIGLVAESAGLIADSLDMLADAAVYAISLSAVGAGLSGQASAARISGYLQLLLGIGVLFEVGRRIYFGSAPEGVLIMLIGSLAFVANLSCLYLVSKYRHGPVHMRASWIFSANDVVANIGVVVAGGLVYVSGSYLPDLVIGMLISALVVRGGLTILREAKAVSASLES